MHSPQIPADAAAGVPLSVQCPCGKMLAVKPQLAGKKIRCPICERVLLVPSAADSRAAETTIVSDQTLPNPATTAIAPARPQASAPEVVPPKPVVAPAPARSPAPKPAIERPAPVRAALTTSLPGDVPPQTRGNYFALLLGGTIILGAALAYYFFVHNAKQPNNDDKELLTAALASSGLPPKHTNALGMEFVLVPKGKFFMGGIGGKPGAQEVAVADDFYLGTYEVTQEEWEKIMPDNPSAYSAFGSQRHALTDVAADDLRRFPVERVRWEDCEAFLRKLNEIDATTGWIYRLPSEAEWEYACRGGPTKSKRDSSFDYYFERPTNSLAKEQANFLDSGFQRTCKVGSYSPNRLGLYDMHGNVFEWCLDRPEGKSQHARRGGAYNWDAHGCRAACRLLYTQVTLREDHGFRVARVPAGK